MNEDNIENGFIFLKQDICSKCGKDMLSMADDDKENRICSTCVFEEKQNKNE